jgi:hypothetical protein
MGQVYTVARGWANGGAGGDSERKGHRDEILTYLALHFPNAYQGFEAHLLAIERRPGQ